MPAAPPTLDALAKPQLAAAHRGALELSMALNLLMFAVDGVVGAWIGSACLLAAAATFMAQAGLQWSVVARGSLSKQEHGFVEVTIGVTLCTVSLAAVGELVRRLIYGGAPSAMSLVWVGLLGLIINLFCASRLMRFAPGEGGWRGLWRLARRDGLRDLLVLAAAGLTVISGSRFADVIAGALILGLNFGIARQRLSETWKILSRTPR